MAFFWQNPSGSFSSPAPSQYAMGLYLQDAYFYAARAAKNAVFEDFAMFEETSRSEALRLAVQRARQAGMDVSVRNLSGANALFSKIKEYAAQHGLDASTGEVEGD